MHDSDCATNNPPAAAHGPCDCSHKGPKIDIVFDGPPDHFSPRFVEIEVDGKSIRFGQWLKRDDGLWAIRFSAADIEAWEASDNAT